MFYPNAFFLLGRPAPRRHQYRASVSFPAVALTAAFLRGNSNGGRIRRCSSVGRASVSIRNWAAVDAGSSLAIGTKSGFRVRKTGIGPAAPLNDVAQSGTFGVSGDSPCHFTAQGREC